MIIKRNNLKICLCALITFLFLLAGCKNADNNNNSNTNEGKDRTGILCAVLGCYFGASYDEITEDYIKTYENFYHIEAGSDICDIIIRTNFDKVLSEMFDVNDLSGTDLKKEAEECLLSCGLTENDLASLAAKIGA